MSQNKECNKEVEVRDFDNMQSKELPNARNCKNTTQVSQYCSDKYNTNDLSSEKETLHKVRKPITFEEIKHKIASNVDNLCKTEHQNSTSTSLNDNNYVYYDLTRGKKYLGGEEAEMPSTKLESRKGFEEETSDAIDHTACVSLLGKRGKFRKEAVTLTLIHMMFTQVKLAIQDANPKENFVPPPETSEPVFNLENLPEEFIPRLLASRRKLRFLPNGELVPTKTVLDQSSYETFDEFMSSTENIEE